MSDTITITDKNNVLPTDIVTLRKEEFTVTGPQTGCGDNIHIHEGDIRLYGVDICTDDGWEFVSATREITPLHAWPPGTVGTATVLIMPSLDPVAVEGAWYLPSFAEEDDCKFFAFRPAVGVGKSGQVSRAVVFDVSKVLDFTPAGTEDLNMITPAVFRETAEERDSLIQELAAMTQDRDIWKGRLAVNEVAEEPKPDLVPFWRDAKAGDWIERHAGDVLRFAPVGVVVRCGGDTWVMDAASTWLNLDGGSSFISSEHLAAIGVPVILSVPVNS